MSMALAKGGMDDFHVISEETAQTVLSPRRREILSVLKESEPESVRDLARKLGRDKAAVSRDLRDLAEHSLIDYEDAGRAKKPVLQHQRIIVEPLI